MDNKWHRDAAARRSGVDDEEHLQSSGKVYTDCTAWELVWMVWVEDDGDMTEGGQEEVGGCIGGRKTKRTEQGGELQKNIHVYYLNKWKSMPSLSCFSVW